MWALSWHSTLRRFEIIFIAGVQVNRGQRYWRDVVVFFNRGTTGNLFFSGHGVSGVAVCCCGGINIHVHVHICFSCDGGVGNNIFYWDGPIIGWWRSRHSLRPNIQTEPNEKK